MSTLHDVRLVAGRELREAFRRKSSWIVVVVLVAGSTAGMVVPDLLDDDGPPTYEVGFVDGDDRLVDAVTAVLDGAGARLEVVDLPDAAAAERAVDDQDVDVAIVGGDAHRLVVRAGEHEGLLALAQQAVARQVLGDRLVDSGLPAATVDDVLAVAPATVVEVDSEAESRRGAAALVAIVLYVLLLMLMIAVANGVAIEKANRISEVLLSIVRPTALLFGKVLGVGVTGMLTVASGLLPVVVRLGLGGDLPAGLGAALLGGSAWFLLGVALYLTVAASLGALVERQEEAGTVITPLTMVLIAAYILGQGSSDSRLGQALAVVPFTSPMVMPTRIATGDASTPEIVLSLVLGVGAVALAARVGSTVYRRAIVRTGRRLTLTEVLRSP